MLDVFSQNPWLIVVSLAMSIPILGIVFGTVTDYLTKVRTAEMEASLKQDMLQRGMSAEEIKMVIEATSSRKKKSCVTKSADPQEVLS
jgi:hypothetical protein